LPETFISVKSPETVVAFITDATKGNPAVDEVAPVLLDARVTAALAKYPDVSMPPEFPSCAIQTDDPAAFVLTPLSTTVIRLTQDGISVKSTLVPEAVTAVPDTMGASVPVTFTSVCVVLPATAGAATVIDPLVSPERTTEAMITP
jgi:hypothetical protein